MTETFTKTVSTPTLKSGVGNFLSSPPASKPRHNRAAAANQNEALIREITFVPRAPGRHDASVYQYSRSLYQIKNVTLLGTPPSRRLLPPNAGGTPAFPGQTFTTDYDANPGSADPKNPIPPAPPWVWTRRQDRPGCCETSCRSVSPPGRTRCSISSGEEKSRRVLR